MPPRTRSSGALVRMNPTREDEAYTKEVLRKTSDGFRAELTSGKSERITQNLRNQDEGTLRLQEYLMAAEVDARPPKKIDTLMDQSDALKLQKSLTALQVAPIQRSRVQEPPKYEITSEDKDSSSSQPQQASFPKHPARQLLQNLAPRQALHLHGNLPRMCLSQPLQPHSDSRPLLSRSRPQLSNRPKKMSTQMSMSWSSSVSREDRVHLRGYQRVREWLQLANPVCSTPTRKHGLR